MKKELEERSNKQVKLMAWSFGLNFAFILLIFPTALIPVSALLYTDAILWIAIIGGILWGAIWGAILITNIVFWILGIVNSIRINDITNNSGILIVFSIFTFGIVGLVISIVERNKYRAQNYEFTPRFVNHNNMQPAGDEFSQKKQSLQNALSNGIITATEFEKKLKVLQKEYQK
ncbi:hypothetical protein [Candidatus Mycoplasma mahonii]|uniref:hypothetical protein n=1 Tax=Candidatus Mycoplasma mahonii TaxID=3004105 RepID=UPI0026EADF18|nr:hypothetical protein [Candidatus Mycoplasma mahonii]WKX02169.1 hypothetical protein O3I44_02080 [Candidatus Mycoplasma mahonii]